MKVSLVIGTGLLTVCLLCGGQRGQEASVAAAGVVAEEGSATASFQAAGEVVITEAGRKPVRARLGGDRKCQTPVKIEWIDSGRVGAVCRPGDWASLQNYFVVNAETGGIEDEYAGVWFAWSPDRKVLAHAGVLQQYGTRAGERYCLMFNQQATYPQGCEFEGQYPAGRPARPKQKRRYSRDAYAGMHTFYDPLVWSPDSGAIAFVEKTFNWEYTDPYNRDSMARPARCGITSRLCRSGGLLRDIQLEWFQRCAICVG